MFAKTDMGLLEQASARSAENLFSTHIKESSDTYLAQNLTARTDSRSSLQDSGMTLLQFMEKHLSWETDLIYAP